MGGFAGDASPYINLLSKVGTVITNPNSVNAAVFSGINENILYTEGYAIDSFFKGELALRPSKYNKIGVLFDKAIPQNVLNVHINTVNAVKSTYGINIIGHEITEEAVGVEFSVSESGISTGNLKNPATMIDAARNLISKGAEAIAVVCFFETPENDEDYANNGGVDPVGGIEAIISHLITREFCIPVAHAPAFGEEELTISTEIVDKRAAAEYITPTFLPCILKGLYNAPKLIDLTDNCFAGRNTRTTTADGLKPHPTKATQNDIKIDDIKALIMPYDSLGGLPVLAAAERGIPIIAVEENTTILDVTAEALNIEIIKVKNYHEAAGLLLAMKNGIYT